MQEASRIFFDERHTSPHVYLGRRRWRRRAAGLIHDRTPRGERAEAIVAVLQFMLGHMNLETCRVLNAGTGDGISLLALARGTGMSIDRIKGALNDLKSCGHVGGYQQREIKHGRYRGKVATRWFTKTFFRAIGMWRSLNKFRGRPVGKETGPGPASHFVRQLAASKSAPSPAETDRESRIRMAEFDLGREHPEWTVDEVKAAARARFRR